VDLPVTACPEETRRATATPPSSFDIPCSIFDILPCHPEVKPKELLKKPLSGSEVFNFSLLFFNFFTSRPPAALRNPKQLALPVAYLDPVLRTGVHTEFIKNTPIGGLFLPINVKCTHRWGKGVYYS
jgi:hypothetical protein